MKRQMNKTLGLIALLLGACIVIPLSLFWNFLPAVLIMTFFAAILSAGSWALLQGVISYKLHLLVWTILLLFTAFYNERKFENKVHDATREKE